MERACWERRFGEMMHPDNIVDRIMEDRDAWNEFEAYVQRVIKRRDGQRKKKMTIQNGTRTNRTKGRKWGRDKRVNCYGV